MYYQVPQHIDKDKVFIVNRSEIEGRLEPEFYRPSIAILEKRIRSLATRRLRDYAVYMAGGATPKKTETDKYYPALMKVVKNTPEYNDAAWLLQYQIESMLDIYKRLM